MSERGPAPIAALPMTGISTRRGISETKVSGYWRPERSLLLVEGTEDLNRGEILGPRQSPLKLEAPAFKREVVHRSLLTFGFGSGGGAATVARAAGLTAGAAATTFVAASGTGAGFGAAGDAAAATGTVGGTA
jgi:hypothetical protein